MNMCGIDFMLVCLRRVCMHAFIVLACSKECNNQNLRKGRGLTELLVTSPQSKRLLVTGPKPKTDPLCDVAPFKDGVCEVREEPHPATRLADQVIIYLVALLYQPHECVSVAGVMW